MEALIQKAGEYIETRIELVRLKTISKSSDVTSTFLTYFILFSVAQLFLVMLSIGLALLIGHLLSNIWLGFMVMALVYIVIGLLTYLYLNKPIKRFIQNVIVNGLLK